MNNHIKEQKEQAEQTITNVSSPLPHKEGKGDKFTPILFLILGIFLGFVGYLFIDHHYYGSNSQHYQKSDTLHLADGSTYHGEISTDRQPNGYGMLITTAGNRLTGEWKNGRLSKGTLLSDKDSYYGGLRNYVPDGYGKMTYGINDSTFIGRWHQGKRQGVGKLILSSDSIVFGRWDNDTLSLRNPFTIGERVYGIDVSRFQHSIDWGNLSLRSDSLGRICKDERSDGITGYYFGNAEVNYLQPVHFVFMKSTDGAYRIDPFYYRNHEAARECGIIVGIYHFLRYEPIEKQIENFIANVQMEKGDLPPVLDMEDDYKDHALTQHSVEYVSMALKWLHAIEAHFGVRPIIYMNKNNYLRFALGTELEEYDCWIANYNKTAQDPETECDWRFWQMSCKGTVNGIQYKDMSHVDLNVFHGNLKEFRKYVEEFGVK